MVENTYSFGWHPNFHQPLSQTRAKIPESFAPKSDALSNARAYEISIELPGVKLEDVDLTIVDNSLSVRGEKRLEQSEEGVGHFFSEREYGAFRRTFRLPPDSDTAKIDASFVDGVVKITIPRMVERDSPERKIAVRRPESGA